MRRETQEVIRLLSRHGDDLDSVLHDEELNRALEVFRNPPYEALQPMEARCGQRECGVIVRYLGLDPDEPRVIGSKGPRYREVRSDEIPAAQLRQQPNGRLADWPLGPHRGHDVGDPIDLALPAQAQLRWDLRCPKKRCRGEYRVTNTRLLALLVKALGARQENLVLPHGRELPRL
jgi:hypothetical protein